MQSIQVGQFKSDLPSILEQVQNFGEKFVIEYGKKHKKVAMLVPFEEENCIQHIKMTIYCQKGCFMQACKQFFTPNFPIFLSFK